uniref:Uncharacterized protein n=1 Tax=Arundo donax TaxID=35708 RepID=A0A0A8Y4E0_ARUDO
MEPSCTGS